MAWPPVGTKQVFTHPPDAGTSVGDIELKPDGTWEAHDISGTLIASGTWEEVSHGTGIRLTGENGEALGNLSRQLSPWLGIDFWTGQMLFHTPDLVSVET